MPRIVEAYHRLAPVRVGQSICSSRRHTSRRLRRSRPIQADPGEDEPNYVRLRLHDLEARHTAALVPVHIAVAEWCPCQSADGPGARCVAAPAAASLEDLGPLILGDHALNLEQQIILGRTANRTIQEYDLHTGTTELVDQQRLMGITAG